MHCSNSSQSINSSASDRNDAGIVNPSVFAVFRLMTSSNLVDSTTGRSAGTAPLRILDADLSIGFAETRAITHQPTIHHIFAEMVHGGQLLLRAEGDDLIAAPVQEWTAY